MTGFSRRTFPVVSPVRVCDGPLSGGRPSCKDDERARSSTLRHCAVSIDPHCACSTDYVCILRRSLLYSSNSQITNL